MAIMFNKYKKVYKYEKNDSIIAFENQLISSHTQSMTPWHSLLVDIKDILFTYQSYKDPVFPWKKK